MDTKVLRIDDLIEYLDHQYEAPVSYTHLDVYKRQRIDCPAELCTYCKRAES